MDHGEEQQPDHPESGDAGPSSRIVRRGDGQHVARDEHEEESSGGESIEGVDYGAQGPEGFIAQFSKQHTGPLPAPETVRGYETAYPGAAKIIFDAFADDAHTTNRAIERLSRAESRAVNIGAWSTSFLAVGGLIAGVVLILLDRPQAALLPFAPAAMSGVASMISAAKGNKKDDKND